jgi:hypothetical protein
MYYVKIFIKLSKSKMKNGKEVILYLQEKILILKEAEK